MHFKFKVGDRVRLRDATKEGWSNAYVNRVGIVTELANYNAAEDYPICYIDFANPPGTPCEQNGWFGECWLERAENGIERARKCLK